MVNEADRFYMVYATADERNFQHMWKDLVNLGLMTRYHPGVDKVVVYVAVSRVSGKYGERFRKRVRRILGDCSWLDLRTIVFKDNTGRDFSSAKACLEAIALAANPEDVVMVRNRSAYGPFQPDWYLQYLRIFERHSQVGLVGNTINFGGLPKENYETVPTHVQTYIYMAKWATLRLLLPDFPGSMENDRKAIIVKGELGLSRHYLNMGWSLACLLWPEKIFSAGRLIDPELETGDKKHLITHLPFRHRKGMKKYPSLLDKWKACRQLLTMPMGNGHSAKRASWAPEFNHDERNVSKY